MDASNHLQNPFYYQQNSGTVSEAALSSDGREQQEQQSSTTSGHPSPSSRNKTSPAGPRFQCSKCPKNFSRIENLTRHQANHDDVGKFVCPVCRKRFTRSDLLNRHRRIHPKDVATIDSPAPHVTSAPPLSPSDSSGHEQNFVPNASYVRPSVESEPKIARPYAGPVYGQAHGQRTHQTTNPDHVALRHLLSVNQFSHPLSGTPPPQGLSQLAEAAIPSSVVTVASSSLPSNVWDEGLFMGLGNQHDYMGTYDADISWTFDNFNAESSSTHSADYDMPNNYEVPSTNFSGIQHISQRYIPLPAENPIDAADNEDDDTNDRPDKVTKPRRAARIVPLRLIPISWQPLLDEARDFAPTDDAKRLRQRVSPALRKSLLDSLNAARHDFTTPEVGDSMFPPLDVLDFFLELYIRHVQPRFPVLHLATFNIFTSPPLLLVAMMILGSSHSKIDRGRFARIFHGPLRIASYRLYELDTKYLRSLDNILTYFLLCLAGTWSGSKESYEFAEGARGVLVTACRRMRLFDNRPAPIEAIKYQDAGYSLEDAKWLAWVEVEKGKRLGLSIYMYDCQYPALFNIQHFVGKAETTNLTFPCAENLWEAPSAQAWQAMLAPAILPKPEYWLRALNCILLHRYIKPPPPIVNNTGEFGKTLLLYAIHTHIFDWRQATCMLAPTGLKDINASWDMGNPLRQRRVWLLDALDSWDELYRDSNTNTAACLLHRLGYIALDLNLSDMHLVAGRSNNPDDGNFAELNLKQWANSSMAANTMNHIFSMLQTCYQQVESGRAAEASYEISLCLFTGGIVCWAFARLKSGNERNGDAERCIREVIKASAMLKAMGCWRMASMFGRILNGFDLRR